MLFPFLSSTTEIGLTTNLIATNFIPEGQPTCVGSNNFLSFYVAERAAAAKAGTV